MSGLLQFAARPEEAPIIHFGGPWEITFYGTEDWHIGKVEEASLAVGTPGLGSGATAFVEFEGVIPLTVCPTAKITYPPAAADQAGIVKSYELTKRCCGINLYGNVQVPSDIATGPATVMLSLPSWPGTNVASTTHTINIVQPKPPIKLEPVSWRIKGSLAHVNKGKSDRAYIVEIQYSPDGKRLIAGDYNPGGVVQLWNVSSGQKLVTIETGPGHPRYYEYFAVSPDWRLVYAPTIDKDRKAERIEKDGKPLWRWAFNDAVQVFELGTGNLIREFHFSSPRGISDMKLAPDGRYFLTRDNLPGDFSNQYQQATSLWNVETGESRQVFDRRSRIMLFSADSKTAFASYSSNAFSISVECLKVLDFPACAERLKIPLGEAVTSASALVLVAENKIVIGTTINSENRSAVKFWDATSGRELASVPAREKGENLDYHATVSPDRNTVAITSMPDDGQPAQRGGVYLLDVAARSARFVDLGEDVLPAAPRSIPVESGLQSPHLSGRKISAADPDPPYTDLPQPRLDIIDVTSGKIVETLIAPQCFLNSLAFSPDGNTLATSGPGEVLLWDFSIPPGQARPTTKR